MVGLLLAGCGEEHFGGGGGGFDADTTDADPTMVVDGAQPDDGFVLADSGLTTSEGPDVKVLDPAVDEIITGDRLVAKCEALEDPVTNSPVQAVKISAIDAIGTTVEANAAADTLTQYSAQLSLAGFVNGRLNVRCFATAQDGKSDEVTREAFLDLGPKVVVASPVVGQAFHGNINISFRVTRLAVDGPTNAQDDVDGANVNAFIAGVSIDDVVSGPDANGNFTGSVSANDARFGTPLIGGVQFKVSAPNVRGTRREVRNNFVVDNSPPTVEIDDPSPGEIVGGLMTIRVTVTDSSGVDPTSVVAVIGDGAFEFPVVMTPLGGVDNEFVGTFDTADLKQQYEALFGTDLVYPTINVRARDLPGNEGSVGHVIGMDYTPPIASLDPPTNVREGIFDPPVFGVSCSVRFDPVGDDAVDDLQTVGQLSEFRARVEDQPNRAFNPSGVAFPLAGVNDATVQFWVLDETDEAVAPNGDALVVDTNGDNICDEINPNLIPATVPGADPDALVINMVGIDPIGIPFLDGNDFNDPGTATANCKRPGNLPEVPAGVCGTTGLQRVIKTQLGDGHVIYGLNPADDLSCMGVPFDSAANQVADGWACVAVRVEDNLGNVGISQPLRVCIDRNGDGLEGCPGIPFYPEESPGFPRPDRPEDPDPALNKTVPKGNPGTDCTGTFNRLTGVTTATDDCVFDLSRQEFPLFEVRRRDL